MTINDGLPLSKGASGRHSSLSWTIDELKAWAALGRTYLMQSEGEGEGEESDKEVLLKAGNAFLKSLDVCDKIVNILPERWEK